MGLFGPPTSWVLDNPISLLRENSIEEDVDTVTELEAIGTMTTLFQLGFFFSHSGSVSSPTNLF